MAKAGNRVKITLRCSECKQRNYNTNKNKKKVQWPTRKQTVNNTVIVIICCIIVGICIWLFDALAGAVITALLDLFGKG